MDPRRAPVLVGVGASAASAEPVELMIQALEAAIDDAGARSLLGAVDRIAVPQGTWGYPDPARLVADRVGATAARTHLAEVGVSQQTLVSDALRAIAAGESEVAVVLGAEARAWSRTPGAVESPQPGAAPDVRHTRDPDFMAGAEGAAGVVVPVEQYALIENALCHAEGVGRRAGQRQINELWARFNLVARDNPRAAFPEPRTAEQLGTASADNRPLAHPYNKWHASQWTVDQGAALVMCSSEAARSHGVAPDRWVFPLVGIDASHSVSLSRRRDLHRWPAMSVLAQAASERIGRPLREIELVEVYSCFPSAVRVQQRELGLPTDGTPTMTGGMAFAGGPFNNFVYQGTVAMVPQLRAQPGALGLVTTVCGLLTRPGLAVWSAQPDREPPLLTDCARAAAAATPTLEVLDRHDGPATVASFTVTFDRMEPTRLVILGDVAGQRRCVAVAHDASLAARALETELIGETVEVKGTTLVG
jgi:acetyl-CoA C-acetyltransferase